MAEFLQDNLRVFVVPVDILHVAELTTHEKMVYIVLRSFANPHKPEAFPSYDTIARLGSMTRRHAISCVKRLVEKGFLKKEIRFDVTKDRKIRNTSNLYTLHNPKVVNDIHSPSEYHSPPLVNDIHSPSEYHSPEHNHLTKSFRTKTIKNNSQSVYESLTIKSIKTFIEKHPRLTDRLADIEFVYLTVKEEPGYTHALFVSTLQKAIKAQINVPFSQYLLQSMINNLTEQQQIMKENQSKKTTGNLPEWVKNQNQQGDKSKDLLKINQQMEALELLLELGEIDKEEYKKRESLLK